MKYENYQRNHVIVPGREDALDSFIRQDYKGMQHKVKNAYSSNSEDALTWSCFDTLENLPLLNKIDALDEILSDSYAGNSPISLSEKGFNNSDVSIHVGKRYDGPNINESTEVDASIEAPKVLIFIEAKLYSAVSPADPPQKPHDQIARKLRIGLDTAHQSMVQKGSGLRLTYILSKVSFYHVKTTTHRISRSLVSRDEPWSTA
ncbi:MAG: hypothetical protein JRG71_16120 [Deltaproteobacteria bacterium]|nr:hypothetical protein [Deltaproteobacteria bacterium]